jgi:hypothetical protein
MERPASGVRFRPWLPYFRLNLAIAETIQIPARSAFIKRQIRLFPLSRLLLRGSFSSGSSLELTTFINKGSGGIASFQSSLVLHLRPTHR